MAPLGHPSLRPPDPSAPFFMSRAMLGRERARWQSCLQEASVSQDAFHRCILYSRGDRTQSQKTGAPAILLLPESVDGISSDVLKHLQLLREDARIEENVPEIRCCC